MTRIFPKCVLFMFLILLISPFMIQRPHYDFIQLKKQMANILELEPVDTQQMHQIYGMNKQDYHDYLCFKSPSNMDVDEVMVVYAPKTSQMVYTKLLGHLNKTKKSFAGYGPKQVALLNKAQLYRKGDYVYLFVLENQQVKKQLRSLL